MDFLDRHLFEGYENKHYTHRDMRLSGVQRSPQAAMHPSRNTASQGGHLRSHLTLHQAIFPGKIQLDPLQ